VINCMMRMLGAEFCPVCREAHVLAMFRRVSLADRALPPPDTTQPVGPGGITVSVTPAPVTPVAYAWSLAGRPLAARGPSITLKPEDLPAATSELAVTLKHPSSQVLVDPPSVTLRWTLTTPTR
jgi:hypothetical protein